jgi:fructokinase
MDRYWGGIEAGGTKFVCAVGTGPDNLEETRFDTTTPEETISRCIAFFLEHHSRRELSALGIGSFGPVDLHVDSKTFGSITSTPKPGWANTDLAGPLRRHLRIPVGFDTDVNAAAFGEFCWGAALGLEDFLYLTIGTGIGGGGMVRGQLMHGLVHPEMGHIFLPRHPEDHYPGKCPFHGNLCFEGLASGPALEERWGKPGRELPENHKAWEIEVHYIALALASFICTISPQRIILGGGVMGQEHLLPSIRTQVLTMLNGYIQSTSLLERIEEYIVPPGLGNRAGVLGAIALARQAGESASNLIQTRAKMPNAAKH